MIRYILYEFALTSTPKKIMIQGNFVSICTVLAMMRYRQFLQLDFYHFTDVPSTPICLIKHYHSCLKSIC